MVKTLKLKYKECLRMWTKSDWKWYVKLYWFTYDGIKIINMTKRKWIILEDEDGINVSFKLLFYQ